MQRFGFGMVVVWWILLGMAPALAQQPARISGATVSTGQQYFVRYCSACHGVHGHGDGPVAAVLQPPPADLTRIVQRHDGLFPIDKMTAYIDGRTVVPAHGSREMPVWGAYLGDRAGGGPAGEAVVRSLLQALIDYLQAIQQ